MKSLSKHFSIVVLLFISFLLLNCGPKVFTDLNKVSDYLSSEKKLGSTTESPVPLVVDINLQNTTDEESNWQKLLKAINTSGLYVALDLSKSTMPSTEFNPDGSVETGKEFIVSLVLPDTIETIAGHNNYPMFRYFDNMTSISAKNVKEIKVAAFRSAILTNVNFPVATELGLNSFYGCKELTEVSFPNVIKIGNGAFRGCTNLITVNFPKAEFIGNNAFVNTALATVEFPAVTEIGNEAFSKSETLINASFPVVKKIGDQAFEECKLLQEINIPIVETIGHSAFVSSGLESINISLATSLGANAFYNCDKLATVTLGTLSSENFLRVETIRFLFDVTEYRFITFPGNLRQIYLSADGGAGTYITSNPGKDAVWIKQ